MTTIDEIRQSLGNLDERLRQTDGDHPSAEDIAAIIRGIAELWEKAGRLQTEFCVRVENKLKQREETIRILEERLAEKPAVEVQPEPVPAPTPVPEPQPEETPVVEKTTTSLADVLERQQLSDLRKAFSLNDRFRYRKELFNGDEARMNAAIDELNRLSSHAEVLEYIHRTLEEKKDNPALADFIKLLEKRKI